MQNLVINQNGIYTFRKSIQGKQLRISLQTSDKLEACTLISNINSVLTLALSNDADTVRALILATLSKFQPSFKQERLRRVQSFLGIHLEQDTGEVLTVIIKRFVDEKIRTKAWTEKTYSTYKAIYDTLSEFIGDKHIRSVTHQDAQRIKKQLQSLPSSINKRERYRGKSIKQILNMDVPEQHLMSLKTINTRLGCYSELFKWSIRNGFTELNVFDGLTLKDNRNARDLRLPFSPDDLKHLFNSNSIMSPNKLWQYWLPILGLYTGARLNELCQLQNQDIKQVSGIWCISITDEGKNQNLKSSSSKRMIPIHNAVLELGFLDYIGDVINTQNRQIFPELTLRNERYAHTPSKWFGNVKQRALVDHQRKSFHSFRHTFVDYLFNRLKLQGNPLVKALVGHSDREITSSVYGSSFEVEDLNSIIQRIDFAEFGLKITNASNRPNSGLFN
jgi:integrase